MGLSFLEGCKCYNLSYPVDYGRKPKIISDCVLKNPLRFDFLLALR